MKPLAFEVDDQTDGDDRSSLQLPSYVSHKVVQAAKIAAIEFNANGSAKIAPCHMDGVVVTTAGYRDRFKGKEAEDGQVSDLGYYVLYADGYESWSPSEAFESGYTLLDEMAQADFPNADEIGYKSADAFTPEQEQFITDTFALAIGSFRQSVETAQYGNEQLRAACLERVMGLPGMENADQLIKEAEQLFQYVRHGAPGTKNPGVE